MPLVKNMLLVMGFIKWVVSHLFLTLFPSHVGHLTKKVDVYGFGIVLLKMISGRRAVDRNKPSEEQY